MVEKLHHYTSIEILALILKNRTIRFNRLDKSEIDDLEESRTISSGINMSKYTFVSCWTESEDENIPLWKLYANGRSGVKISFPKDFFEEYTISSTDGINVIGGNVCKSILPWPEIFTSTHMFVPLPIKDGIFYRPIEYVDDIQAKIGSIAGINDDTTTIAMGEVGKYKHKRWEFQNETRFVLTALPKPINMGINHPDLPSYFNHYIRNNIELPFNEYYLKIRESAFDNMEITLCPSATESQFLIVDALLKMYAPKANLRYSNLKDKVNFK